MISLKKRGRWWVMAVGENFGDMGFEGRELCRAKLQQQVSDAGIVLDENVWVYDENECAQLVLDVCDDEAMAEEKARKLEDTGLTLRVVMEFE